MSVTEYLSIEIDYSKLDTLDKLIDDFAEIASGEVMGTGFNLMTGQRDYTVEFDEQQNADTFRELVQSESKLKIEFFEPEVSS